MYALIRARVHRGTAVEDVANVSHGNAPFVHPPVAVGSRSNLHGILSIEGRDTPEGYPGLVEYPMPETLPWPGSEDLRRGPPLSCGPSRAAYAPCLPRRS